MYSLNARDHFNCSPPFLVTSTTKQMRPNGKGAGKVQEKLLCLRTSIVCIVLAGGCRHLTIDVCVSRNDVVTLMEDRRPPPPAAAYRRLETAGPRQWLGAVNPE